MTRILAPLLFGLIGAGILIWLGLWQVQRLAWKEDILARIENRIAGDPAPLPAPGMADPERDRYQPVALTGTLGDEALLVLVSRKRVGAGYLVISALTLEDGRRILLDRGFVPVEARNADRAHLAPVQVTGNLHWPDDRTSATPDNDIDDNTWFARDIDQMAAQLGTEPLLVIARNMSPPDPGVTPLPVDTSGIPNDHMQYAVTWFSLAAIWLIMTAVFLRRQHTTKG